MELVQLRLCIDAAALDGDERRRGPLRQTRSLSDGRLLATRAALDQLVDATGRISFRLESDTRRGAGISFARRF